MKAGIVFSGMVFLLLGCDVNSGLSASIEQEQELPVKKKQEIIIEKELMYDKHSLMDEYPYRDTVRMFQWDKIKEKLAYTDSLQENRDGVWGIIQNKRNVHGLPPMPKKHHQNEYKVITDEYGVDREQAAPLYTQEDLKTPERYGYDGTLVKILSKQDGYLLVNGTNFEGEYYIPEKYVHYIQESPEFIRAIVIDRNNQNISTFEKENEVWKVRSMNPCTTGAHHPPLQKPTPIGTFVIQNKLPKMQYYVDGTTKIGGFAPWASRFCEGAYMHGVPVNKPHTEIIEYSQTLGTIPRSHMCVRNASSHAKFIYDNFPVEETMVYVIE